MADKLTQDAWKKQVAEAAAKLVEPGMIVGLGSGSTALLWIEALGRRMAQEGLRFTGVPSSEQTAEHARQAGIPLGTLAEYSTLDLDVDGADEIQPGTLFLIKGLGGALFREKMIAVCSRRMAVIGDESKLVEKLGTRCAVPVEVVPFGWQTTEKRLAALGSTPRMRMAGDGKPFVTDNGNYILDCAFGAMEDPKEIAHHLDHVTGAVEHGLFLKQATEAIVAGAKGLQFLKTGK